QSLLHSASPACFSDSTLWMSHIVRCPSGIANAKELASLPCPGHNPDTSRDSYAIRWREATGSADGRRMVIKAVNYAGEGNTLLVRLQGAKVPPTAAVRLHMVKAGPKDSASLEHPDAIAPVSRTLNYAKDLTLDLDPFSVAVVEIRAE